MRRTTHLLICMLLAATGANAAGDDTLTLTIDPSSGAAWIENLSGSDVVFDGYMISSAAGKLDTAGWFSLEDRILADAVAANDLLGDLGWEELAADATMVTEATFGLGTTAAPGFSASVGQLISELVDDDISFTLNDTFGRPLGQTSFPGEIRIVPEPSAAVLAVAAVAGIGVCLRRKRNN